MIHLSQLIFITEQKTVLKLDASRRIDYSALSDWYLSHASNRYYAPAVSQERYRYRTDVLISPASFPPLNRLNRLNLNRAACLEFQTSSSQGEWNDLLVLDDILKGSHLLVLLA